MSLNLKLQMDGITLQHAGELLTAANSTRSIHPTCFATYKRCLEDFAFAVAFGDTVTVPKSFPRVQDDEPASLLVHDPRIKQFIEPLGPANSHTTADAFSDRKFKSQLSSRLREIRSGIKDRYYEDWITREVIISFGGDESLAKTIDPDLYRFSREPDYLCDRSLQDNIPPSFIEKLKTFLRRAAPSSVQDILQPATDAAVTEFISRNILTHVTNGLRYEWTLTKRHGEPRIYLPHITRGLAPRASSDIRDVVVVPVLADVLRSESVADPSTFIDRLLFLRDTADYRELREYFKQFPSGARDDWQRIGAEMSRVVEHWKKRAEFAALFRDTVDIGEPDFTELPDEVVRALRTISLPNARASIKTKLEEVFPSLKLVERGDTIIAWDGSVVVNRSTTLGNMDVTKILNKDSKESSDLRDQRTGLKQALTRTVTAMSNKSEKEAGGDHITIGAGGTNISRSTVSNAFNRVKDGYGDDTADALKKVEEIVEKSGNEKAVKLFNAFTKQLGQEEPDKTTLESLWDSLLKVLPAISSIAGAVAAISKVFG
jgi:hypothetical protein